MGVGVSHWNNRVCKETKGDTVTYEIREVYYNDDGEIWAVTQEPVGVHSAVWDIGFPEDFFLNEMKETIRRLDKAMTQPIIDLDTIIFASNDDDIENMKHNEEHS